jgi:hypothetical protein
MILALFDVILGRYFKLSNVGYSNSIKYFIMGKITMNRICSVDDANEVVGGRGIYCNGVILDGK